MPKKLISIVGELLLTAGLILFLYLFYSVWFSNLLSDQNTNAVSEKFIRETRPEVDAEEPDAVESQAVTDGVIGLVYIPKLQEDVWALPLNDSISFRDLASGLGHYPQTSQPGEQGNFAIAGHRATNGEPFAYFEKLRAGDVVIVQTREGWFEYELVADKKVQEDEVWVLASRPEGVEIDSDKLITLTTCDPRWNSYQRWVWWGKLVNSYSLEQVPLAIG